MTQLKTKVALGVPGISYRQISLIYSGQQLANAHTLTHYDVKQGAQMFLVIKTGSDSALFTIQAKTLTGGLYDLQVDPQDSISDLKAQLAAQVGGLQGADLTLLFSGVKLSDNSATLEACNIRENSAIMFVMATRGAQAEAAAPEAAPSKLHIICKPLSMSSPIELDVESSDLIDVVRLRVAAAVLMKPADIVLIFSGKRLEDGRTVASYQIKHMSHLNMVVKAGPRPVAPPPPPPMPVTQQEQTFEIECKTITGRPLQIMVSSSSA